MVPYKELDDKYAGKRILARDSCDKDTVAVLLNGATMIPICKDCLESIKMVCKEIN